MKLLNWLIIVIAVFGLVGVRAVEDRLFYDPFLDYFHIADKKATFPEFEWGKLVLNYVFRFSLNLIFSLIIVHFIFKRKDFTFQAGTLITLVFLITLPIYLYCIYTHFETGYLFSFYMRRFVIQPLIILLIIPIFYYRNHLDTSKEKK